MTDEKNPIGTDEAREALGSVKEMQKAAGRRGVPPRWLGVMVASLFGVMFTVVEADVPRLVFPVFITMWA